MTGVKRDQLAHLRIDHDLAAGSAVAVRKSAWRFIPVSSSTSRIGVESGGSNSCEPFHA
jgi:hypothetical protein